ncbi:unknown [Bacteroides sp. CAG:754]|jgi:ribosomal protein L36|nr:unknown [Bacteroides sp. CAG:754]
MCFKTRCKISKYEINIIPTYGMKVKIINRYGVFLTINKNEKRKSLL